MASGGLGTRPLTPVSRLEHYRLDTLATTRRRFGNGFAEPQAVMFFTSSSWSVHLLSSGLPLP